MLAYCQSLRSTIRRPTRVVMVGGIGIGGDNPVRIQSMTTTDTKDVAATVAQCIALAEAGCEIVRVTAPNITAAHCLKDIRRELNRQKVDVPLVADIHFLPAAAMAAVEHVEKVRINPGNYADRKKFAAREYSDSQYEEELQRLHASFSPLVKRCRELGRAMRIGTNHGSLSDRIMNRYGDTPLGMVESALEFLRIAESHDYREIILSMKASNPKVMIQAYRLLVARMAQEDMHYPLHLGVTEAGDGEDGRIKSAIGIGSLLADGLGDTIRVSLTEDPVFEIPVAKALVDRMTKQCGAEAADGEDPEPYVSSPFSYSRRPIEPIQLAPETAIAADQPPRVFVPIPREEWQTPGFSTRFSLATRRLKDNPIEGVILEVAAAELEQAVAATLPLAAMVQAVILSLSAEESLDEIAGLNLPAAPLSWIFARRFGSGDGPDLEKFLAFVEERRAVAALDIAPDALPRLREELRSAATRGVPMIFSNTQLASGTHAVGSYRQLTAFLKEAGVIAPVWIRNTAGTFFGSAPDFLGRLLEASILSGSLLCDGVGDIISIETESDFVRSTRLCYNVLQGAGARISKTEFVACPSCGRTLFDLQSTTQRIRERTGHLKGVKLAIMGCIVNGPGEMADADFGYVGGGPGRVNLYVGKECVRYNVPEAEADSRLVELIKEHGKWIDPEMDPAETTASTT